MSFVHTLNADFGTIFLPECDRCASQGWKWNTVPRTFLPAAPGLISEQVTGSAQHTNRGTQQTVSVNICSEDLLSPKIFGLKYDEKLEYFFSSNFRDMGNLMPVVSGVRDNNVVLCTKKKKQ